MSLYIFSTRLGEIFNIDVVKNTFLGHISDLQGYKVRQRHAYFDDQEVVMPNKITAVCRAKTFQQLNNGRKISES
jgi:hypothetical protein